MTRGFDLIPSILWHPHQGLWNLELMAHVTRLTRNQQEFEKVLTLIVRTDTFIRFIIAILERMTTLGPLALYRKAAIPQGTEVLYLAHQPSSMASKFYALTPPNLLDEWLCYMEVDFGLRATVARRWEPNT